jgi:RNA polymerase sigma factor (sigma-70 family)
MNDMNLIRKIAWSFHKSTGYDWDDLFQEAAIAYIHAMKTYDPSKGYSISTYVWGVITNSLKSFLQKENLWSSRVCDLKEARWVTRTDPHFWEEIPLEIQGEVEVILRDSELLLPLLQRNEGSGEAELVPMKRRIRKILKKENYREDCIKQTINYLIHTFS